MQIEVFNLRFLFKRVIFFFVLVFAITSCKNKAPKDASYTIGFSQCVGSDLWRKTMLEEMRMELSLHPNTNFVYEDANNNSEKQITQVKKMLNEGIDLLIISPNEARPLTPIVEEAYHKGIPVIVIDRKTASDAYTAYVGADNYQIGKMAGEYVGSTSKGPINLLEVMGLPGSSPAIERERGFQDGIKKFANVHIINKVYGDWVRQNAETQLLKIKDRLPDINTVFAHNDVMGAGARDFLNRYKPANHIKVIGVDALPGTGGGLQMVADKVLSASVLYPTGGKEAIVTAFRILNHEPFSRENILQSSVIDSSNVQLMKMQWNRISSQQKDIEKQQSLLVEQESVYNGQQVVLNIIVITLVLAIIFGGVAFYSLVENRKITRSLEAKNKEILDQRNQLVEMSAKAEAATEAKFNFFTNISHEFRTPLTLMLSPLEDIMKQDRVMAIAGRNIQMIRQNAYRLLGLVNQLLDYRKIEYDKKTIKASQNDLISFLRGITECFRHHAEKLNIQLSLISEANTAQIWFDPNMLDKVFFNLIGNAIKFSGEKGKVTIRIKKEENGFITIEVEDNGLGMNEEETTQIFDQFYQADHAPLMGSGIGLSLSKQIVELHQGHIEVRSAKWRGTTFTVSLPVGKEHLPKGDLHIDSPDNLKLIERSEVYRTDLDRIPSNMSADAFSQPKEYTILLIEDNQDLLQYMQEKFADYFEVYTATTGMAGLNEAYERVPDLIITDVVLPQISGKSICEKLKSDIRTSHIPIILLTAQNSTEQQISGIQAMADLYVTKPFHSDLLIASVQNLIRNRLILKEHFTSDITPAEKLPVSKALDKKFINDFSGIVEQNLGNDQFNVDDICKLIGISRVQLYRKVKALLGCSITEYILNRRLKKAKYLLTRENYTIAEITYMTGFSTPNYFSTVFKTHCGCSPTEYKKQNQAIEPKDS